MNFKKLCWKTQFRMDNKLIFGWHTSITPTIIDGIQFNQISHLSKRDPEQFNIAAQIFLKSPMRFGLPKFSDIDIRKTKTYIERFNIFLVVHGSYLINFIRPSVEVNFAIKSLIDDIRLLDRITIKSGVVIHLGKKQTQTTLECIKNFGENIIKVIQNTKDSSSKIILETSVKTKKGSDIFHDIKIFGKLINHLKEILGDSVFKKRIGCCIDSCHIYASGYDIRTKEKFEEFTLLWDKHIGIENISLFHLNDLQKKAENSCEGLGCCRDLHEEISKGLIYEDQKDGLKALLLFAKKNGIPVISESGGNQDHELKLIKKLIKN